MKQYLSATIPWLGGKRAVAREIMMVINREHEKPGVLADAFLGAGSISIAAKALGWEVRANDMSPISEAVGHALVKNRNWRLREEEIAMALIAPPDVDLPPEKELALPRNCRTLLARMVYVERDLSGMSRWMARAWIAKTAISMATWGVPTMAAGLRTWDQLTPGQAQQLKRSGRPMALARKMAETLNNGVFDNGRDNTFTRGDALDFIGEQAGEVDCLYLDPPYPGTLSYEQVYAGVAHLLDVDTPTTPSPWSAEDGWNLLGDALDQADGIPMVVVSMGKGADPDRIVEMMTERGWEAGHQSLDLKHLASLKKEHDEDGDELLIVGRKGD